MSIIDSFYRSPYRICKKCGISYKVGTVLCQCGEIIDIFGFNVANYVADASIEIILSEVKNKRNVKIVNINGRKVSINPKLATYKKSTKCAICGIEATKFLLAEIDNSNFDALIPILCSDDNIAFTVDHIIPKSKGGRNHLRNYRPTCFWCNNQRGNNKAFISQKEQLPKKEYSLSLPKLNVN